LIRIGQSRQQAVEFLLQRFHGLSEKGWLRRRQPYPLLNFATGIFNELWDFLSERMIVLPSKSARSAILFKSANGDLAIDGIYIRCNAPAIKDFSREQGRTGVSEEIQDHVVLLRAGSDNAFDAFERFLGVATRYILLHPIENLLNIDPHISRPYGIGLTAFQVLGQRPVNHFIIAPKNLSVFPLKFYATCGELSCS